jgi:two-component system sensor histidine kinase/response regulator
MADEYEQYLPAVDVNDGLKRVMGKKDLYLRLLGRFNPRKMVEELLAVIDTDDYQKIKDAAHAVKGASGNLGLISLTNIMLEVETRSKEGRGSAELTGEINKALIDTEEAVGKILSQPA